jgi:hypothetical protein
LAIHAQVSSIQTNLRTVEKTSADLRTAIGQTDAQLQKKAEGALRERAPVAMANFLTEFGTNVVHFNDEVALSVFEGNSMRYINFHPTDASAVGVRIDSVIAGTPIRLARIPLLPKPPSKVKKQP